MGSSLQSLQKPDGEAASILESITDAFFSLNTDWEFAYLNSQAEKVLELTRGELLGKRIWDVYADLEESEFGLTYKKVAREKVTASFTAYYPHHDRWYEVHVYPAETGISVFFRNVTERVRSDEKLRESELRFRLMADSIPQLVWIVDEAGGTIFFNKQWSAYTGVSSAGLFTAESVTSDFLHPDDHAHTLQAWSEAREQRKVFRTEHRIRSFSGEYRWFLVRADPYFDPQSGKILRWYGTSTDVHDRKLVEAELHESRERFQKIVSQAATGVIETDTEGRIILANHKCCEMFGYTETEMLGASVFDFTDPGSMQKTRDVVKTLAEGGSDAVIEKQYRRKDGSVMWATSSVNSLRGPNGEFIGLVAVVLDVTERVAMESALRESEARFRTIADAMPQMVWSTRPDGYHDYFNRQWYAFTGAPDGATNGEAWNGVFHPDDQDRTWKVWRHSLETGAPYEIEYRLRHHSGQYRWTLGRALPVRDDNGTIIRWMGTCTDIQEQKVTQQALQEADRRKDEFLAMLAHELRNPLAPISAAAELMEIAQLDPARMQETWRIVARQVRHMSGLVDDLLDVSRVTRGRVTIHKSPQDLKSIVSAAIEQVRPLVEARRHHLTIDLGRGAAHVSGDQKRLVQVLTNLLNNAAKYTPEGGNVHLEMKVRDQDVVLVVKDDGVGIAPEFQQNVFSLFSQFQRSSDRSEGGLGVGLALVKSLVEIHGGTVGCTSAGVGQGSQFTVSLPRILEPHTAADSAPIGRQRLKAADKIRVLLVDDNVDAAQMLAMYLQAAGHEVTVEHSAKRTLERATLERPDVCVLDIGLPEMDGYELARRLRTKNETGRAVLIAVTGYGQEQDRANAIEAGFDHHLVKPIDCAHLLALISEVRSFHPPDLDSSHTIPAAGPHAGPH